MRALKIAFLGSRGIPARYSGFETFYEQLGVRLAARGHEVSVYNRSHFIRDVKDSYHGVRLVSLPSIPTKHLDTITHTFASTCHALFQGYDIAYYCIVGNAPLAWLPRLAGAKVLLNVDGEDWAREKWKGFARWYQRQCEWLAARSGVVIVADAKVIDERYRSAFGVEPVFVPYGANLARDEGDKALKEWGLRSREYVLFVGRLVPENAVDVLLEAFGEVATEKKLVIVGDAPYMDDFKKGLQDRGDERVIFTGYAFGAAYAQLSSHAYLYVQPSAIEGTRPALLDQLGFGNCVLARGNRANREVVADCGEMFNGNNPVVALRDALTRLLNSPDQVARYRAMANRRIEFYYNWDWVADFYEDLFQRLLSRRKLASYDDFLAGRTGAMATNPIFKL